MRQCRLILITVALVLGLCVAAHAVPTKFYGEITAIDYVARTLEVAGTTVYATDATVIIIRGAEASFDNLMVGQTVKVVGSTVDGQFVAKRICVQGKQIGRPSQL